MAPDAQTGPISHRGRLWWGAATAVCLLILAALIPSLLGDGTSSVHSDAEPRTTDSSEAPPTTEPPEKPPSSGSGTAPRWQVELASLVIAPEGSRDGYDRSRFRHWIDSDADGCDTRCEVLVRQRTTALPGLAGGGWLSTYDGYSTDDPSELDVDHVVALAEAWDSGAAAWNAARREAFANDLGSGQLIAVTAATNRSKSDRDPAEWQPPNRNAWCEWGAAWIGVKAKWELTADQAEVSALNNIMRGCS